MPLPRKLLGEGTWKLGFTIGFGQKFEKRKIAARDGMAVLRTIASVKKSLGLAADAEVRSGYEAGRDGFWLHRFLVSHGLKNLVMDSSSLEVNRRGRRAKTDDLDGAGLLDLLVRYWLGGPRKPFRVVRVPAVEEEDRRHLHRDLQIAKRERARITNRMKGLLASHGVTIDLSRADSGKELSRVRQWDGSSLPPGLQSRLRREWKRVELCTEMIRALEAERREILRARPDPVIDKVLQLNTLRGIAINSSWLYVMEFFGGIGRESGIPTGSPRWRRRSRTPASIRACLPTGGVCSVSSIHRSGLSDTLAGYRFRYVSGSFAVLR